MKEDYLWDKTGADPAIEKLENALRVFSYDEGPQLALPVVIVPEKRGFLLRFAPLAFAMASLVIAAIAWGVWIRFSAGGGDQGALVGITAPQDDTPPAPVVPGGPDPAYTGNLDAPGAAANRQVAKTGTRPRPAMRGSRTVRRTVAAENKPKFTKEEIYAYDQLVLALSITSDKLGQVREKAIGER